MNLLRGYSDELFVPKNSHPRLNIASTKNRVADALSRFPPKTQDEDEGGKYCIDALFEHLFMEGIIKDIDHEGWLLSI